MSVIDQDALPCADSSNWQIRLAALRAAAEVSGPVWAAIVQVGLASNLSANRQAELFGDDAMVSGVKAMAKIFERYLETGE